MTGFSELFSSIVLSGLGIIAIWAFYKNLFTKDGDDRHVDE